MKRHILTALITSTALFAGHTAIAQDGNTRFGLGVSTMGATLEGAYRINERFALRGLLAGINASDKQTIDGIDYDVDGQLGGLGLLVDYYPGQSGFRLSGGAFISRTEFTGSATANSPGDIDIDGTPIAVGDSVTTSVEFGRKVAPMLTLGYDQSLGKGWTLSGEIGAIISGDFNVDIDAPAYVSATDIANEEDSIRNDLNQLGVYPYVGLSVSYRF